MQNPLPAKTRVWWTAVVTATDVSWLWVSVVLHDQESPRVLLDLCLEVSCDEHGSVHPRRNHEEGEFLFVTFAGANLEPNDIVILHDNLRQGVQHVNLAFWNIWKVVQGYCEEKHAKLADAKCVYKSRITQSPAHIYLPKDHTHLVSESADLGVGDFENRGTAGGGDNGDTGFRSAQLEETFVVGCQGLVGDWNVVVMSCEWERENTLRVWVYILLQELLVNSTRTKWAQNTPSSIPPTMQYTSLYSPLSFLLVFRNSH
jgi:hypothetical protein